METVILRFYRVNTRICLFLEDLIKVSELTEIVI